AVLKGLDTADVTTHRSVELQCLTTSGGFRRTEHHADLLTQLVNEDSRGAGVVQCTGHLTQCLGHQTSLETHLRVTLFTFNLGLWRQRRHRATNDTVDST